MLRRLGTFERALFISDAHSTFNVVMVLRMENPPVPEAVEKALRALQARHPLLQAGIHDGNFVHTSHPLVFNLNQDDWLSLVEQEMNTRLDSQQYLFRGIYNYSPKCADLVMTFHHAIVDAVSGMNLLEELLKFCASDENLPLSQLEIVAPAEEKFPGRYKGLQGALRIMQYAFSQIADEMRFQLKTRSKRTPLVQLGGRGFASTITLPEELVDALTRRYRTEGVTLNSLLNSALVLAANRHLYAGKSLPMRTFSFANLRPYVIPPLSAEHLANYITMMRFTVDVSEKMLVWDLAKELHSKIYHALKHGDKFTSALMSELLMKMFTRMKSMRMGASAVNYSGSVPLKKQYGNIRVTGVHAFLSSFDLGPEVSCQVWLFNNELWLDFMFLDTDMDRTTAEKIVHEVKSILEDAVSTPGGVGE